ncbi:hypothetical protein HDU97_009789 [Phlyctochytrium planicorne]|nr:hypothetical protein HDU97_009789 [Phlyctochytrium planicorne]
MDIGTKWLADISSQEVQVDLKKYIEREIDILRLTPAKRDVRHPNVVQFMGCSTNENKLLLVTEFVAGGNVKEAQWINDLQKDLTWRTRISIATDTARALAYLHAHDIIHRDMKSDNLLITENNRVKVCDFGFSRPTPKTALEIRRLSFCGTDTHMAPEIILGMPFDAKVDVFSFGVVLCELAVRTAASTDPVNFNLEEEEKGPRLLIPASPGSDLAKAALGRVIPGFGLNPKLVKKAAGVPETTVEKNQDEWNLEDAIVAFVNIALKCCEDEPSLRPSWKEILTALRGIEKVVEREEPGHLGVLEHEEEELDAAEDFESLEDLIDASLQPPPQPMSRATSIRRGSRFRSRENLSALPTRSMSVRSPSRTRDSPPTTTSSSKVSPTSPLRSSSDLPAAAAIENELKESCESAEPVEPERTSNNSSGSKSTISKDAVRREASAAFMRPNIDVDSVFKFGQDSKPLTVITKAVEEPKPVMSSHRFSIARDILMRKCDFCRKRTGLTKHLICDDCGKVFHKHCGQKTSPTCQGTGHYYHLDHTAKHEDIVGSSGTLAEKEISSSIGISKKKNHASTRSIDKLASTSETSLHSSVQTLQLHPIEKTEKHLSVPSLSQSQSRSRVE